MTLTLNQRPTRKKQLTRLDPSRTTTLRRDFIADINKRFLWLRGQVLALVVREDAFGLRDSSSASSLPGPLDNALGVLSLSISVNRRFAFETDPQKLESFQTWLQERVDEGILETGTTPPWTAKYIDSAYRKGALRAYTDVHARELAQRPDFYAGSRAQFLESSFGAPERLSKIQLLATRTYDKLKTVPAGMAGETSRIMSDGLAHGWGPAKVARELNKSIDGFNRVNARRIARTEIIHAHAEGQLDSFDEMGLEEVTVMAEWATAKDDLVCPLCLPLDGVVLTVKEARGILPRHPNCRCCWLPAGVGEKVKKGKGQKYWVQSKYSPYGEKKVPISQKTTKYGKTVAFRDSIKAELPGLSWKEAQVKTSWMGARRYKLLSDLSKTPPPVPPPTPLAPPPVPPPPPPPPVPPPTPPLPPVREMPYGFSKAKWRVISKDSVDMGMTPDEYIAYFHIEKPKPGPLPKLSAKELEAAKAKAAKAVKRVGAEAEEQAAKIAKLKGEIKAKLEAEAKKKALEAEIQAKSAYYHSEAQKKLAKQALLGNDLKHQQVGMADFAELWPSKGKKAYGGVLFDEEGRILLREPTDHFDGYHWTFAKGQQEKGHNVLKTALKEVAEETGHQGQVIGVLEEGFKSSPESPEVHMFLMRSKGFKKSLMDWETQNTKWCTYDEAVNLIKQTTNKAGRARDLKILEASFDAFNELKGATAMGVETSGTLNLKAAIKAGYKKVAKKAGQAAAAKAKAVKEAAKAVLELPTKAELLDAHPWLLPSHFKSDGKLFTQGWKAVGQSFDSSWEITAESFKKMLKAPSLEAQLQILADEIPAFAAKYTKGAAQVAKGAAQVAKGAAKAQTAVEAALPTQVDLITKYGLKASDFAADGKMYASSWSDLYKKLKGSSPPMPVTTAIYHAPTLEAQLKILADEVPEFLPGVPRAAKKAVAKVAKEAAGEAPKTFPGLADLKKIKDLPGSTHPELMAEKATGEKWVMKSVQKGIAPEHLKSEVLADKLYNILGLDVPESAIVRSAEGPTKLSRFLEGGEQLGDWLGKASASEKARMFKEIADGFVSDALLANHDVAGLSMDNILVVKGKPYRIDNGGALLFRAQGARKQGFGAVVQELESLRDASINPNTAKIFEGITNDRINEQIEHILLRRDALLEAIDDAALRKTMSARLDYLEAKLPARKVEMPPGMKPTAKLRAKARQAEPEITKETAQRVRDARINGVTIRGDRGDIEDMGMLAWEERDVANKAVTKVQFKVTPSGSQKIEAKLGEAMKKVPGSRMNITNMHPEDKWWDTVEAGAKTVGFHAADGEYNMMTLQKMLTAQQEIWGAMEGASGAKLEMLKHYDAAINRVKDAWKNKTTPKMISHYVYDAEKAAKQAVSKPGAAEAYKVERGKSTARLSRFENGRVRALPEMNNFGQSSADEYLVDLGDGVKMQFARATGTYTESAGLAFQGRVHITVQGQATEATLTKAMQKLKTLGIDTTPPTPAYEELVYLHRNVYLRKDHNLPEYLAIFNDANLSDAQKVTKIKEWASKKYKVDFAKLKSYNPQGETMTSWGDGYRHFERWDIPREKMKKEMEGYVLTHSCGEDVATTLRGMLQSGGETTCTIERVRKGVKVGHIGMSSSPDVDTGGANYWFTRISTRSDARNRGQLWFKIENLSRQDVVTYSGDRFGRISAIGEREYTPKAYKRVARNPRNETDFKHAMSILDDIEYVCCRDEAEKRRVLDVFRSNKVTHFNDGRPIEEVVQTKLELKRKYG